MYLESCVEDNTLKPRARRVDLKKPPAYACAKLLCRETLKGFESLAPDEKSRKEHFL